ncbi:helix-turn-helix domain-containing protein [Longispora urticae]
MDAEATEVERARFGARLRYWRTVAGLTQAQLGKLLGYHHSYLCKVERGQRWPPGSLPRRADDLLATGGELDALWWAIGHDPPPGPLPAPGPDVPGTSGRGHRFPTLGITCPLHGLAGCTASVDPATVRRPAIRVDPAAVHTYTALLATYTQADLESTSTGTGARVEESLHAMTHALRAGGRFTGALLALCAHYAQLAGWLRVERGQYGLGMAWLHRGLDWARASGNIVAGCEILGRMSTIARLEDDPRRALDYARAAGAVGRRHRWPAVWSALLAARAHALLGDGRAFDHHLRHARVLLDRLGDLDRIHAPWLHGAEGAAFVDAFASGGLRDLAAASGDRRLAVRAADSARSALAFYLPARMRLSHVLLVLRLADTYACARDPEAAVATATGVLHTVTSARETLVHRELAGLRARLHHDWADTAGVRDFDRQLRARSGR